MSRARSFRKTFSQTTGFADGTSTSTASNWRSAVRSLALWQVAQYRSRIARWLVASEGEEAGGDWAPAALTRTRPEGASEPPTVSRATMQASHAAPRTVDTGTTFLRATRR